MKNQRTLENGKKLKHGSLSVIITVVVIAAVVIANVIFSAFAYKNNWYIDLTKKGIYSLSDEGRALLDTIDPNAEIKVRFCRPYDELEAETASKMVFELVKEMASEYDNITYDYIDIIKNYTEVQKYKSSTTTSINKYNVIVESGSEHRVFALEALFIVDTDTGEAWAFNGEYKLISAMVQCTQTETPIAYFTNTHGEVMSQSMLELFYDAGYEVKGIDLTKEEISEDARLIVISGPRYDFEGKSQLTEGRLSEIEKLDDFLDGFGSIIVTLDPETGELPQLETLLSEWGIAFEDAIVKDPANALDREGLGISGQYSIAEDLGAQVVSNIIDAGTPAKTILYNARPVKLLFEDKNNRYTAASVYTSDNAAKYVDGIAVEQGQYPLIALSRYTRYIDNEAHHSYVFAIGSQYFIADEFLAPTYANRDILHNMMRASGRAQVPVDLDFKPFDREDLDILFSEAVSRSVGIIFIPSLAVLLVGIVIFIRRKNA